MRLSSDTVFTQSAGSLFFSSPHPEYMTTRFDYIIAGAGCAGLGLVWKLLSSELRDSSILILDPDPKNRQDRTWCFWDTDQPDLPCTPSHIWDQISISTDRGVETHAIGPHRYYHLEGKAYYDSIRKLISDCPNVIWKKEAVIDFTPQEEGVTVTTNQGSYDGNWAFSSIPTRVEADVTKEHKLQHFYGVFLTTERPVFDPETVDLMDFRVKQEGEVRFYYVLPFSETEALVEFTVFSDESWDSGRYQKHIDHYLHQLREQGSGSIEIQRSEKGVIPMTTAKFPIWQAARVMNIGIAGGAARPGTGYAFQFIQKRNREIVDSLIATGAPDSQQVHRATHQFYDALLLRVMDNVPEKIADIFSRLFRKHSASLVLTFLSEQTTLPEDIRIMTSLQWGPFLKALCQKVFGFSSIEKSVSKKPTISIAHAHRTP